MYGNNCDESTDYLITLHHMKSLYNMQDWGSSCSLFASSHVRSQINQVSCFPKQVCHDYILRDYS
jgi:hypothetical protein